MKNAIRSGNYSNYTIFFTYQIADTTITNHASCKLTYSMNGNSKTINDITGQYGGIFNNNLYPYRCLVYLEFALLHMVSHMVSVKTLTLIQ